MHRTVAALSGLVLMIVLTTAAHAAGEDYWQPPRVEIGGFGGVMDFDHARGVAGEFYGGRFGINFSPLIGFEAAVGYSELYSDRAGFEPQEMWMTQANMVVHFVRGHVEPFVAGGIGTGNSVVAGGPVTENQFGFDFGGGLKLWLTDYMAIRGDVHTFWSSADNEAAGGDDNRYRDMMMTGGLSFGLGSSDTGPTDADWDGVSDELDRCPDTPYGIDVDGNGCPVDTDRDGVPDHRDDCNTTQAHVWVDDRGCPTDEDADGVADGLDRCLNTPAGAQVDARGCPIDSDGDGVYDGIDACMGTPEGVEVDEHGCGEEPEPPKVEPIERRLVLHNVTFASGSSEILPSSYAPLNEVAQSLIDNAEIKVEVRGFADSTGPASYNLVLTQQRAESVRAYLISRGVDGSRLTARGYGEEGAIATNETAEGRAMNRRVEFHRFDDSW